MRRRVWAVVGCSTNALQTGVPPHFAPQAETEPAQKRAAGRGSRVGERRAAGRSRQQKRTKYMPGTGRGEKTAGG